MSLENSLENNQYSKSKILKDSVFSMTIPLYNVYLVNRAIDVCNEGSKKLKAISLPVLTATEFAFYAGAYGLTDGQISDFDTVSLIMGTMGKFKGIAWGILKESDPQYRNN